LSIRLNTSSSRFWSSDFGGFAMSSEPPLAFKPNRYNRRLSKESRFTVHAWAKQTAETLWAWNSLQAQLFHLFCELLADTSTEAAYAIWHMFQSDKNQREMLLAVAETAFPTGSRKLKQLAWLVASINRISPFRNAVVHTASYFQVEEVGQPHSMVLDDATTRKQMRLRLELAGPGKFWAAVAGDLFVLSQYAVGLTLHIGGGAVERGTGRRILCPSPHKPRLLSLQQIIEIEKQIGLLHAPKGRKRQRRASRASSYEKRPV
jgi:hypothetical protein